MLGDIQVVSLRSSRQIGLWHGCRGKAFAQCARRKTVIGSLWKVLGCYCCVGEPLGLDTGVSPRQLCHSNICRELRNNIHTGRSHHQSPIKFSKATFTFTDLSSKGPRRPFHHAIVPNIITCYGCTKQIWKIYLTGGYKLFLTQREVQKWFLWVK